MPHKTSEQLDQEIAELMKSNNMVPAEADSTEVQAEPAEPQVASDSASPDGAAAKDTVETSTTETKAESTQPVEGGHDAALEERLKNTQSRMHQATQEAAELRKQNEELSQQFQAMQGEIDRLKSAAQQQEQEQPQSEERNREDLPQDLQSAMEDYPEVVTPLVQQLQALQQQIREVEAMSRQSVDAVRQTEAEKQRAQFWNLIRQQHPDADDVVTSDDFRGWLGRQPQLVQGAAEHGGVEDAIFVLNLYKQTMGIGQRKQKTPPVTPSLSATKGTPQTKSFTRDQLAAMSPAEYAKNEAAIDEALANGWIS